MPDYRTPGVYIEEISSGPRPVQASSTTETGMVAVITIPSQFVAGVGEAGKMYLPGKVEDPHMSWSRARAFRRLSGPAAAPADSKKKDAKAAPVASGNSFRNLVTDVLPGKWDVKAPTFDGKITLQDTKDNTIRFPVSRALMSTVKEGDAYTWDLSDESHADKVMDIISAYAEEQGVAHTGTLTCANDKASKNINVAAIHDRMHGTAPCFSSMEGFHAWRQDWGARLFTEILCEAEGISMTKAEVRWDTLNGKAKAAWANWLRNHPGMRRLELAVTGFFANGGATAFPAVCLQEEGTGGPAKRIFLEKAFDGASVVAMLCAPGLEKDWQQAILDYAGPEGR